MNLLTKRCIIRRFSECDTTDLYEVLSCSEVMQYIEPPFDFAQTRDFIRNAGLSKVPSIYALVWTENEKVIGHVIFHPYDDDSCEIGWIISRDYWGKGIASEVTASLLKYAKEQGINGCVIECAPEQIASAHIAKKFGFRYMGENDGCSVYYLAL